MEEKVLSIFREIFSDVDPEEVTLDADFREWDQYTSLTQMELISKINEDFGIQLKLLLMVKAETISDVLDAIQNS